MRGRSWVLAGAVGMVALAGQVRAQAPEPKPAFKPVVSFNLTELNFANGIAIGEVINFGGNTYPEVAVAIAERDLETSFPPLNYPQLPGSVALFQNNGTWTNPANGLELADVLALGDDTSAVDLAFIDIDQDGFLDLVVTSGPFAASGDPGHDGNTGVYVFMRDQSENSLPLIPSYSIPTPTGLHGITVADFNNDGFPEAAAASAHFNTVGNLKNVYLLKNIEDTDPDGFGRKLILQTTIPQTALVYNSQDVVANHFYREPIGQAARIDAFVGNEELGPGVALRNDGNFVFTQFAPAAPCVGYHNMAWDMATAKLTPGIFTQDIVALHTGAVHVIHATGTGGFSHNCLTDQYNIQVPVNPGVLPGGVAIGHLNGGSKLDVAAVTQNSDKLHVLVGNGNGTFDYVNNPTFAFPLPGLNVRPVATAIADLDLDGLPDVVVVNHGIWENTGNPSKVYVLINGLQITGP